MFKWLTGTTSGSDGILKMSCDLERMITEGRHAFDTACSALSGGADPAGVRQDLLDTDKRIDKFEQSIRRQIVVHASVHGARQIPEMMVLMSVAKDAERIGDYAKNIFDVPAPGGSLAGHDPQAPPHFARRTSPGRRQWILRLIGCTRIRRGKVRPVPVTL